MSHRSKRISINTLKSVNKTVYIWGTKNKEPTKEESLLGLPIEHVTTSGRHFGVSTGITKS